VYQGCTAKYTRLHPTTNSGQVEPGSNRRPVSRGEAAEGEGVPGGWSHVVDETPHRDELARLPILGLPPHSQQAHQEEAAVAAEQELYTVTRDRGQGARVQ